LRFFVDIIDICVGDNHCSSISDTGVLFMWGDNSYG
jgi:alpha-tubulin suppressor-like RCC1 family protein